MSDLVDQVATAILAETPANYVTQNIAQAHRNAEIALAIIEPVIRADERERIAQAIEACRAAWNNDWRGLAAAGATVGPGTVRVTYDECARIARNGGSNE